MSDLCESAIQPRLHKQRDPTVLHDIANDTNVVEIATSAFGADAF